MSGRFGGFTCVASRVVGSYTDGLLVIRFDPSTPDPVMSAFSALVLPGPRAAPPPVVEAWSAWEPDWRARGYAEGKGDPFESEPWRHDWASQVDGVLRWAGGHWELLCRFLWKTYPQVVSESLAWLAPFVASQSMPRRQFVGYAHHEYDPAPHLFWVENGQWQREDMNPEGYFAP